MDELIECLFDCLCSSDCCDSDCDFDCCDCNCCPEDSGISSGSNDGDSCFICCCCFLSDSNPNPGTRQRYHDDRGNCCCWELCCCCCYPSHDDNSNKTKKNEPKKPMEPERLPREGMMEKRMTETEHVQRPNGSLYAPPTLARDQRGSNTSSSSSSSSPYATHPVPNMPPPYQRFEPYNFHERTYAEKPWHFHP